MESRQLFKRPPLRILRVAGKGLRAGGGGQSGKSARAKGPRDFLFSARQFRN